MFAAKVPILLSVENIGLDIPLNTKMFIMPNNIF
jgi:hypothetical protein